MKRTIVMTETRRLNTVRELQDFIALLPPGSTLRDVRSYDGQTTVQWEENR